MFKGWLLCSLSMLHFLFFDWKWGKVEYVHSKEQIETSWNISGSSLPSRFALLCETNEQWNQKVQHPIKKQTLCLIKNWQITPQVCLLGHRCNTATLWKSRSERLHSHLFELDQKMEIAELEADKVAVVFVSFQSVVRGTVQVVCGHNAFS